MDSANLFYFAGMSMIALLFYRFPGHVRPFQGYALTRKHRVRVMLMLTSEPGLSIRTKQKAKQRHEVKPAT